MLEEISDYVDMTMAGDLAPVFASRISGTSRPRLKASRRAAKAEVIKHMRWRTGPVAEETRGRYARGCGYQSRKIANAPGELMLVFLVVVEMLDRLPSLQMELNLYCDAALHLE